MTRHGTMSSRRCTEHDYSSPGTYHLELPLLEDSAPLVRRIKGRDVATEEGRIVLRELGESLHRQGRRVRLDALELQPLMLVLVVTVLSRPNLLRRMLLMMDKWLYQRRMALIPLFVGHVKMNSARRINTMKQQGAGSYWREGYRDRVVYDAAEAAALVARVGLAFGELLYRDGDGEEKGTEGMVLGWAYVVTLPTGQVDWTSADSCIRMCGAIPPIQLVGAAQPSHHGRDGPRILTLDRLR
ncbi:MAG TPA: hypothetical protein PK916_06060 [Bacteroidota bacterium]|nr:hypothetical protein [Bacteroidota bacterium]